MINISDRALKLIPQIGTTSFRGVQFVDYHVDVPDSQDWIDDGKTIDEYYEFAKSYCCASLTVDTDIGSFVNDYTEFNSDQFERDLLKYLQSEFGQDVEFRNFNVWGREFEIQRKEKTT